MATTNVGILTVAGKNLVDRVNAGSTKISYTKVVLSSMDNSSLTDVQLAELIDVTPQEVVVSNPDTILDTNNGETKIRGNGDNTGLTTGIYIKTYAVYAKDDAGKEILYGITISDHPNYMAPFDGLTPQAITYTYRTKISQTSNINFTNSTDVYVSDQDLKDAVSVLVTETDFTDKLATKEDKLNYVPADDNKVVHNDDSDNWQKQKLTADDGSAEYAFYAVKVSSNSGSLMEKTNFLQELLKLPKGFHTFYCEGGTVNNPAGTLPIRGTVHITNKDADGTHTILYFNATSSVGKAYSGYYDDGTWSVGQLVDTDDTSDWQKQKVTADSGDVAVAITVANGKNANKELLAIQGLKTVYIEKGAAGSPASNNYLRGVVIGASGTGYGVFSVVSAANTPLFIATIVGGTVVWRRGVDDNNDGTITVNGNQFTPADVAKTVQVANSVNWQKRKITNDDGSFLYSVSSGENIQNKILSADAGVTTWYIQVGATGAPTSDSLRGQLIKDTAGFGGGYFTANNGEQWRLLVMGNSSMSWQRIAGLSAGNDLDSKSNIHDIYLTKYGSWVADAIDDYQNSFRNRLLWDNRPFCPKGTDFGNFLKSNNVPTGMCIARDDNTSINWFIIKESSTWIYGFSVSGGQGVHTLNVNNGVYATAALPGSLKDLNDMINNKATIQSDGISIANYPDVWRGNVTGTPNMNNYTVNGMWGFSGVPISNGPQPLSTGKQYGYFKIMNAGGVVFQEIHAVVEAVPQYFKRVYSGSPAQWGPWAVDSLNPAS